MTIATTLFTIEYMLYTAGYPLTGIKEAAIWIYKEQKQNKQ